MLARSFGLPFVITARGTDVNVLPNYVLPRAMIRWAAEQADGLITVSSALAAKLAALGIAESKITVLRNGVDAAVFRPTIPYQHEGSTPAPLAISVGNLVPSKGHDLAISALRHIEGLHLWIVGGGPDRSRLETLSQRLNLSGRVRFLGAVPHERMPEVYSAADVLILASEREGWPNVVLEAMACGARVVATNVSDVSTILHESVSGTCLAVRSVEALVNGLRRIIAAPVHREATRAHAVRFGWHTTTRGQIELFRAICARHSGGRAGQSYPRQ
jgi:teichuronic acid biosynthesis glycosyltransferase TuaC